MSYEVVTFLSMNGRGAEAIDFYLQHLSAKVILKVTYEDLRKMDSSVVVESGKEKMLAHSVLKFGTSKIMIAEETMVPKENYIVGNNTSLCVQSADKEEIEKIYNSLIQDPRTEIIMPLGKIVFSETYGVVRDPFGVCIQLMYDKRLAK